MLIITSSAGLTQGSGSAAFNFSGGTLQAATAFSANVPVVLTPSGSNGIFFDTNGNSMALAGGMSGSGNLTKIGSGTLILNSVSTGTGSTAVTAGTLAVLADNASLRLRSAAAPIFFSAMRPSI